MPRARPTRSYLGVAQCFAQLVAITATALPLACKEQAPFGGQSKEIKMKDRIEEIFQQVMNEACPDPLRRFAELVAVAEREACAKAMQPMLRDMISRNQAADIIRARGKHEQD